MRLLRLIIAVIVSAQTAFADYEAIIGDSRDQTKASLTLRHLDDGEIKMEMPDSGLTRNVEGSTTTWGKGDISYRTYPLRNGFEFEIILHSPPSTNVFTIPFQTTGLDFYYQPPLDEEIPDAKGVCTATECDEDGDGTMDTFRPENIVGSYAVYYSDQGKRNNEYKTGKAYHIYRPKVHDDIKSEIWATMQIANGDMTLTVPQDFLDSATYPVVIDPTLGNTSLGGSNSTRAGNVVCFFSVTATEDGTVDSIHLGIDGNSVATVNAKGTLYITDTVDDEAHTLATNGVSPSALLPATASGYTDINYVTSPTITNGVDYEVGGIADATLRYYYDNAGGDGGFNDNSYTTPTDMISNTSTLRDISFYITYTAGAGGGGDETPNPRRVIITHD